MKKICRTQIDLESVRLHMLSLSLDKPVIITIEEYVKNRSNDQNRLMHHWLNKIAEHYSLSTGESYSPKAWKELLKEKFLGFDMIDLPDGSVKAITKHTADCSTSELNDFLEKIDHYAVDELGLMLPRPDDLYWNAL